MVVEEATMRSPKPPPAGFLLITAVVMASLLIGAIPAMARSAASARTAREYFVDPAVEDHQGTPVARCVRYGSGPATLQRPDWGAQEGGALDARNEIRWGYDQGDEGCDDDAARLAGLAFDEVRTEDFPGLIDIGQLTHIDTQAAESLSSVTLRTLVRLVDHHTQEHLLVPADLDITLRNAANLTDLPGALRPYTGADCAYQPGALNALDGSVVPAYVASLNVVMPPRDLVLASEPDVTCANSLLVTIDSANPEVDWGEHEGSLHVAGWSDVDADGTCDTDSFITGPVAYTAGGVDTQLCLFGILVPQGDEPVSVSPLPEGIESEAWASPSVPGWRELPTSASSLEHFLMWLASGSVGLMLLGGITLSLVLRRGLPGAETGWPGRPLR